MAVRFRDNDYLRAVKKEEGLKDNHSIYQSAHKELKFKHGHVNRKTFNEHYSKDRLRGRKLIALPAAVWSGCVKTTYHLTLGVLVGSIRTCCGKGCSFKANLYIGGYNAGRDIQEAYGRITSIFNSRYGQFHIQESQFQRSCYKSYSHRRLFQLSTMTPEKLYKMFPIVENRRADPRSVKKEEIAIEKAKKKMAQFDSKDVNLALKDKVLLERYHLNLLAKEQFSDVELSEMSKVRVQVLLEVDSHSDPSIDKDGNPISRPHRINYVQQSEIEKALHTELLNFRNFHSITMLTRKQFTALDLSKIPKKIFDELFALPKNYAYEPEITGYVRSEFQYFDAKNVKAALTAGLFTTQFQLSLITPQQLAEMGAHEVQELPFEVLAGTLFAREENKVYFKHENKWFSLE